MFTFVTRFLENKKFQRFGSEGRNYRVQCSNFSVFEDYIKNISI